MISYVGLIGAWQLDVPVVLVRGSVDGDLRDQSLAKGVLLLDYVPLRALQMLRAVFHVDLVTYLLDARLVSGCFLGFTFLS